MTSGGITVTTMGSGGVAGIRASYVGVAAEIAVMAHGVTATASGHKSGSLDLARLSARH